MRVLQSKDGDLINLFDNNDQSVAQIGNTSIKHLLIDNHGIAGNKGKLKGQLPSEHIADFIKVLEKLPNN